MEDVFDALIVGPPAPSRRGIVSSDNAWSGCVLQKPLSALIGPGDARYPSGSPGVIALEFGEAEWLRVLFLPDRDWHALAGSGNRAPVLRLMLPPGPRSAAGVSRLARRFPQTRFLIDPFRHGSEASDGWQSQVCLAEYENVWITTLGLAAPACRWPDATAVSEALYFVVGEVGAGRLLFASGGDGSAGADEWLRQFAFLDAAQRDLILRANAAEMFA